nr:MAG TPA: hypothetical protein [Caudoviricetes sp.]
MWRPCSGASKGFPRGGSCPRSGLMRGKLSAAPITGQ